MKKNDERTVKKSVVFIAKIATKFAVIGANTRCPFYSYQPAKPASVKKLRKF